MERLHTDDEAQEAVAEAKFARAETEQMRALLEDMRMQVDLGSDGMVGKLRSEVLDQEEQIETLQRANETLKKEIEELQEIHMRQLQQSELETRELYMMIRDANPESFMDKRGILDRKELMDRLERQLERKKTEFKLEGKVWQPGQSGEPSDRLRQLREQMDPTPEFDNLLQTDATDSSGTQFGSLRTRSAMVKPQNSEKPQTEVESRILLSSMNSERKLGGRNWDIQVETEPDDRQLVVSQMIRKLVSSRSRKFKVSIQRIPIVQAV